MHMASEKPRDNFLIDGFPRNQDNMNGWLRQMGGKAKVRFVLFFDCEKQVGTKTLSPLANTRLIMVIN